MARTGQVFESFHEGMSAGHEAGRAHDVLYLVGFMVGFAWGAISATRLAEQPRPFERIDRTA
jgi:hypothetical protein